MSLDVLLRIVVMKGRLYNKHSAFLMPSEIKNLFEVYELLSLMVAAYCNYYNFRFPLI